jgi:glycine cleavage system aminomethyltransferase T
MLCKGAAMTPYRDWDQDSGVQAYDIEQSHIDVQFKDGAVYRYTSLSAGQTNLDHMARLARAGDGLNAFINRFVKNRYSARLR